jgi:phosphohistidine phosphatase
MAAWLAAQDLPPEHIVASDALRTRRTADYLVDGCGLTPDALECCADLYLAPPARMLAVVRALPDHLASAAVVAHNPGVTDFANHLLETPLIDDFPTFGIAAIDIPGRWADTAAGAGHLVVFRSPKTLD